MAVTLKDRVKTACTSFGKTNIVFGETRTGFQGWEKVPNGDDTYYCLTQSNEWEVGYGTKSDTGLTRNVLDSSDFGNKLSLSGDSDVFLTYPADVAVVKDIYGNLLIDGSMTAKAYFGDASTLDNLPTLETLGLENHDKITVTNKGDVTANSYSGDGSKLTGVMIDLKENGLENHDQIKVDSSGTVTVNNLQSNTIGQGNEWTTQGLESEIVLAQYGASKMSVDSSGQVSARTYVGDGTQLDGLVEEAPEDGKKYARIDKGWSELGNAYLVADDCIYLNKQEIINDYVMPVGYNGMTAGPILQRGDITIPEGSEWTILGGGGSGGGEVALQLQQKMSYLEKRLLKMDTIIKTINNQLRGQ